MNGACCPSCAVGAPCEAGCSHHHIGGDHVGDVGTDILNVLRSVDDALSTYVVEPVLDTGIVPYGETIRQAHDMRRAAQEAAAPRTGPGGIPGLGPSPARAAAPAPAPARPAVPAPAAPRAARNPNFAALVARTLSQGPLILSPQNLATSIEAAVSPRGHIRAAQWLVRRAWSGDAASNRELIRVKESAARGVPEARREWALVVAVMRDERKAIERAAR